MRGRFITVEGQDGAGKSTNIAVIQRVLEERDIGFVLSREPGGTRFGERVRDMLLNSHDDEIGDVAELLVIFAARAQHLQEVIEPALAAGRWVLCDRFTDATYAYQGGGRQMDVSMISSLENLVQRELRPDLTLLLDVPVEVGETRADKRSEPDRFEQQKQAFKRNVRACYLDRANAEPARFSVIDASQTFVQVERDVRTVVKRFIDNVVSTDQ
ncbi:dTMP kinase [Arenicella xantha]|uniref:Thymidylate kinase n=1 Tax=Arenicella xantha TaxID=644221 RepID=A0A395JF53_9GAMM|nr:dTMP kinase [Arenicella xantha]RBP48412.1 thymidylate kinase [Arenicella xantha]